MNTNINTASSEISSTGEFPRCHVHHSYIWLGSLRTVGIILITIIFANVSSIASLLRYLNDSFRGILFFLVLIGVVFALLVLIVALIIGLRWWSYRHLYYQLLPHEFALYLGILNKRQVHVPYQRIQSVDQQATFVQRIFGVCSVLIDTAGGSSNKAICVPYVQKSQAEYLRVELFSRKQSILQPSAGAVLPHTVPSQGMVQHSAATGTHVPEGNVLDAPAELWQHMPSVFGGESMNLGHVSYEYGLTNKELFFTGVFNSFPAVGASLLALCGLLATFVDFVLDLGGGSLARMGMERFLPIMLIFLFGIIGFIVLASALGTCLSYGGFHARRRGSRIEVERGLLQHVIQGVDIDRVQSVQVKQNLIFRLLGYCKISLGRIEALDQTQKNNNQTQTHQGLIVHPFVKTSKVPEVLAGLLPEYADLPVKEKPLAKVALRRALIRRGILQGLGFYLVVAFLLYAGVVALLVSSGLIGSQEIFVSISTSIISVGIVFGFAVMALEILGAIMWYRGSSFAYNRRFMCITNGGWTRTTINFPRQKIQFGYTRTNPFQRRAQTATVVVRTAAGVGGTSIRLIDVGEEESNSWLEWLIPQNNAMR